MPECAQGCGPRPAQFRYDIPADLEEIPRIVDEVVQLAAGRCAEDSEAPQAIALCLQEGLVNAVVHGSKQDKTQRVQCWVALDGDDLVMVVRDPGPGFDFVHPPDPLQTDALGFDHGRGLHLMKQLMDDVHYARRGAELHLRKRLA
jgi:serine/threonine-protein kinase RsbW